MFQASFNFIFLITHNLFLIFYHFIFPLYYNYYLPLFFIICVKMNVAVTILKCNNYILLSFSMQNTWMVRKLHSEVYLCHFGFDAWKKLLQKLIFF